MDVKKKAKGKVKKAVKVVSSIIEITPSTKKEAKPTVDGRSLSLQQYHTEVGEMAEKIVKFALALTENRLSVKMALMQSVQRVEKKMREVERDDLQR